MLKMASQLVQLSWKFPYLYYPNNLLIIRFSMILYMYFMFWKIKCHFHDKVVLCSWSSLNTRATYSKSRNASFEVSVFVGWLYWGFTSLQRYFSHITTCTQEITNLWKFKWRGGEGNPGPLAPQAKSLTTRPLLLPDVSVFITQSFATVVSLCHFSLCYTL